MLARWTRTVLRFRWLVLAFWAAVIVVGFLGSIHLNQLLENTFTVPGTDSERARTILQQHFGDRSDGSFIVVFRAPVTTPTAALEAAVGRGATVVPTGTTGPLRRVGEIAYANVNTTLTLAQAKGYTDQVLHALRPPPGVSASSAARRRSSTTSTRSSSRISARASRSRCRSRSSCCCSSSGSRRS